MPGKQLIYCTKNRKDDGYEITVAINAAEIKQGGTERLFGGYIPAPKMWFQIIFLLCQIDIEITLYYHINITSE